MQINLLTYNILKGGENHIEEIFDLIKSNPSDVICLQETCGWQNLNLHNKLAAQLGIKPNQIIYSQSNPGRSSANYIYDLVTLTRYRVISSKTHNNPSSIWHSICESELVLPDKHKIVVINAHLSSKSIDWQQKELDTIEQITMKYPETPILLMGDLNALTKDDPYPKTLSNDLQSQQITKFGNPPRFETIDRLTKLGFTNHIPFSPTVWKESTDKNHLDLRLDYILIKNMPAHWSFRGEIMDTTTYRRISDHLPVKAVISAK